MAKAPQPKIPARKPVTKPKAPRPPKRTPAERKAQAIHLILIAIASGWTITRFAKHSHVSKGTLLRWLAEDTVIDRYIKAMQAKGLALPDEASEIVRRMIDGRRVPKRDENGQITVNPDGSFAFTIEFLDPKAGRAALSHIEFRMMREIKAYRPRGELSVVGDASAMSDEQLDAKFNELMDRHQKAQQIAPRDDGAGEDS